MNTQLSAALMSGRTASPHTALRFSQISNMLKCPVVGLCLSLEEQRKLVRKAGVCVAKAHDFDIHEILVNTNDEDTLLARQVNVLLRKKYELKAAPLRRMDLLSFVKHWDDAFASGKYATELWAAATRPDLPLALQRHIFGCVHMDMHEALGDKAQYVEQAQALRQERATLTEKLRAAKAGLAQTHKDMQTLRRQHEALQRQKDALDAENRQLHNELAQNRVSASAAESAAQGAVPVQKQQGKAPHPQVSQASDAPLRARVEFLEHSLAQALSRAQAAEKGEARAVKEREAQQALVSALQEAMRDMLTPAEHCATCTERCSQGTPPCAACQDPCAACSLCPQRILMVGGMTRLEALYRNVVEAKGHEFEYHDGYLGGVNNLEASLQKADIVLCPVSCNSHRACLLVKNLCKKYQKTVHMMPNYSLSAVSKVLDGAEHTRL